MQGADLHVRELKILSKRYERVLLGGWCFSRCGGPGFSWSFRGRWSC